MATSAVALSVVLAELDTKTSGESAYVGALHLPYNHPH